MFNIEIRAQQDTWLSFTFSLPPVLPCTSTHAVRTDSTTGRQAPAQTGSYVPDADARIITSLPGGVVLVSTVVCVCSPLLAGTTC